MKLGGFGFGQSAEGSSVINLKKGEKLNLTKDNPRLDNVMVGLGWKVNEMGGYDFDLDASVFMVGYSGKVENPSNFIFFNNLTSPCGSVQHTGDDLTGGDGDEDDEVIKVKLSEIPKNIEKVVFAVTIYEANNRRQNFGMVSKAFIRVVNDDNHQEICRYNLADDYSSATSVIVAELSREGDGWKFDALGDGKNYELGGVCREFGLNV